jgi:hypothetical protein
MRAEASSAWALETLSTRLRAGDAVEARELAATMRPSGRASPAASSRKSVNKAHRVAHGLDEPAAAAVLLKPLRVETLARRHAAGLAALVERYGEGWARAVLEGWLARGRPWAPPKGRGPSEWISSLARLCEALQASGDPGLSAARLLVQESRGWLRDAVVQGLGVMPPSRREEALGELGQPIAAVLQSAALIGAADLADETAQFLCQGNDDLTCCLVQVLRAARAPAPAGRGAPGIDTIEDRCVRRLKARLAGPDRADDDWSIELPGGCGCELCTMLGEFLSDRARRSFEWPLAKEGRRHIHSRIDAAELPVRHQTRRTGRPYTLVLTKNEALFERDRQARRRGEADLAWLSGGPEGPGHSSSRRSRKASVADPTGDLL